MTTIDVLILIVVLLGAVGGYRHGLVMSLFSLAALILGVLGAFKLMGLAIVFLDQHWHIDRQFLPYIAFGIVFILIVIGVNLLGRVVRGVVHSTPFGMFDQVFGACLGILRSAFMLSVIFWIMDSMQIHLPEQWTDQSTLYPLTIRLAPQVTHWVGMLIPWFRDIFNF